MLCLVLKMGKKLKAKEIETWMIFKLFAIKKGNKRKNITTKLHKYLN